MSGRWLSMVFVVLLVLPGCAKKAEDEKAESSEHDAFVQSAEQKLADIDAQIDTLKVHVSLAGDKAKVEMQQEIDQLGVERQNAQTKLDELRAASEETWEKTKVGFAESLDSLDAKFDRARARLH